MKLFDILLEATPDEIYDRYYNTIDRNTFNSLVKTDPRTIIKNNEIIKIGPYSKLIINLWKKDKSIINDLNNVTEILTIIYKYNLPVNINNVNNVEDLENIVKEIKTKNDISINNILNKIDNDSYSVFDNNEKYITIIPKTEKASCVIGVNTEWCTTYGKFSLNPKYKTKTERFSEYNTLGNLYVIINKNNPNEKYQIHFETEQIKDVNDNEIPDKIGFLNKIPTLKYKVFDGLKQDIPFNDLIRQYSLGKSFLSDNDLNIFISKINKSDNANPLVTDLLLKKETNLINIDGFIELNYESDDNIRIILKDFENPYDTCELYSYELSSYNKYRIDDTIDELLYSVINDSKEFIDNEVDKLIDNFFTQNNINLFIGNMLFKHNLIEQIDDYINDKIYELTKNKFKEKLEQIYVKCTNILDIFNLSKKIVLSFNKDKFINFIIVNKIKEISNIDDFVLSYLDYFDISLDIFKDEYPQIILPELDMIYDEINKQYQEIKDNVSQDCYDSLMNISKLINEKFIDNIYRNDHVIIKLIKYECGENGLLIKIKLKKLNKTFEGYINPNNLYKYMSNIPMELNEETTTLN